MAAPILYPYPFSDEAYQNLKQQAQALIRALDFWEVSLPNSPELRELVHAQLSDLQEKLCISAKQFALGAPSFEYLVPKFSSIDLDHILTEPALFNFDKARDILQIEG